MPEPEIISFEQAISDTEGQDRTLLLGNGFSIDYFDYSSLLEESGIEDSSPLKSLFANLDTKDFELVMRSLEEAATVERVYGNNTQSQTFIEDANALREGLIHAINETHPNRNNILERIPSCINFIKNYSRIFTLNYDLLLYWVQMENQRDFKDGFGLGEEQIGFRGPFHPDAHCNVYNLHGGLHLFKTSTNDVEKRIATSGNIIEEITDTIRNQKRLPLYVAEGTSDKKLAKIKSVPYLFHCLDTLGSSAGNIFIYGHSASENDAHIYRSVFLSQLEKIYFCIHRATTDVNSINGNLQMYKAREDSEIEIVFVDSETAHVWNTEIEDEEDE